MRSVLCKGKSESEGATEGGGRRCTAHNPDDEILPLPQFPRHRATHIETLISWRFGGRLLPIYLYLRHPENPCGFGRGPLERTGGNMCLIIEMDAERLFRFDFASIFAA
jgi:hypothetical protein